MTSDMKCPYYQGVCGLNENFVCYTDASTCDIYRDYLESKNRKENTDKDSEKIKEELLCETNKKVLESSMDTPIYGNRRRMLGTEMVERY